MHSKVCGHSALLFCLSVWLLFLPKRRCQPSECSIAGTTPCHSGVVGQGELWPAQKSCFRQGPHSRLVSGPSPAATAVRGWVGFGIEIGFGLGRDGAWHADCPLLSLVVATIQ